MELANYIETAMKSILKNPIYEVLSDAPADLFVQPAGKHPYRLN